MADLQGIYNRLNSGSQYTPLSAETFGDWSMEAGDLITVTKDGQSYASPVMIAGTDWRGAGTVTVESAGNREREPLSVLSRKKFSGGGGGYWNSKKAFTRIEKNDNEILLEAQRRESDVSGLQGSISVQAHQISLVVEGTGENAHIKPASIVTAINNSESSVKISAVHIILDGEAVADSLATQYIRCNGIESWGTCEFKDGVTFESDVTVYEGISCHIGNTPVYMNVADVEKSSDGKSLTITYVDGTSTTFSKAVTLNGAWNNGTYSVSTTPNVGSESTTLVQLSGDGEVTNYANGNVAQYQKVMYEGSSENPLPTGARLLAVINASGAKNTINMPTAQIYTTSGSPPSGSTQASTLKTRVQQAIADNDTVVFRIDCGGSQKYYYMDF